MHSRRLCSQSQRERSRHNHPCCLLYITIFPILGELVSQPEVQSCLISLHSERWTRPVPELGTFLFLRLCSNSKTLTLSRLTINLTQAVTANVNIFNAILINSNHACIYLHSHSEQRARLVPPITMCECLIPKTSRHKPIIKLAQERKKIPLLPQTWIVMLHHLQLCLSLYVIRKGEHWEWEGPKTTASFQS